MEPGAELKLEKQGERYLVLDSQGRRVGRTSQSFKLDLEVERCEVAGVVIRFWRIARSSIGRARNATVGRWLFRESVVFLVAFESA